MRRLPFSLGYLLLLVGLIISGQSWAASSNILPIPLSPYSKLGAITPFLDSISGVTNNAVLQRLSPGNYVWATPSAGGGSGLSAASGSGGLNLALSGSTLTGGFSEIVDDQSGMTTVSVTAADANKDVIACASSAIAANIPTAGGGGTTAGFGFRLVNAASYLGQACTGVVTLSSGSTIDGVGYGTIVLQPGQWIDIATKPSNAGYVSAGINNPPGSSGGSYLPLAGGTMTGQIGVATGTASAPSIGTAGQTNSGINFQGGTESFYRLGSFVASISQTALFGSSATAIATDNNVNPGPAFELNYATNRQTFTINNWAASVNPIGIEINHSTSNAVGTHTAIANNVLLGKYDVGGDDGTNLQNGGGTRFYSDTAWSNNGTVIVNPSRGEIWTIR